MATFSDEQKNVIMHQMTTKNAEFPALLAAMDEYADNYAILAFLQSDDEIVREFEWKKNRAMVEVLANVAEALHPGLKLQRTSADTAEKQVQNPGKLLVMTKPSRSGSRGAREHKE